MTALRFTISGFEPDYGVHPGETLKELLREAGWSQAELARRTGLSQKHISRVITGNAGIGADMALLLERETNVSARMWASMQAAYDVYAARVQQRHPTSFS